MACAASGLVDVLLLKVHQRLQPLALLGVFQQRGLLQPQPVDGLLQIQVLLTDVAQVEVVLPQAHHGQLGAVDDLLRRRDHRIGPEPDQPHARSVRRVERTAPAVVRRTCTASPMICANRMASSTSRFR